MATIAHFTIVDYDGKTHRYYRFLDGYPKGGAGVFVNFPLGDRDFCLETFERRLNLEKSDRDYFSDVFYNMDLRTRHIKVHSKVFVEDINFEGTFEEAIRHFAFKDYSEKEAIEAFPEWKNISRIIYPGFIDGMWTIIKALKSEIPCLEYDLYSHRIIYIGDNINFYMYQDFIYFPECKMNRDYKVCQDAYLNARRVGVLIFFNNTVTNSEFTLRYMLTLRRNGYLLPLTGEFIRYDEGLSDKIKEEELAMLVKSISLCDPEDLKARNYIYEHLCREEMNELRDSLK